LRNENLAELERVEFCRPAMIAIAEAIASSPLLTTDSVFDTLSQLQGAFYAARDELPVDVPDDEIIEALAIGLDELGDASEVATTPHDEIMTFSKGYVQALEAEESTAYRIVDDDGHAYAFDSVSWDYDEAASGWDGERWSDDWDNEQTGTARASWVAWSTRAWTSRFWTTKTASTSAGCVRSSTTAPAASTASWARRSAAPGTQARC
jgi:hypothetical protein